MDDRIFDQKSALEWIETIESDQAKIRQQDIYPEINNWLDRFSLKTILEVGCGQGDCASKIDLKGRFYRGVEPSGFLLERAKENVPSLRDSLSLGNAYELPFPPEKFEGVFSVAVWHLLENLDKANGELSRVLKSQGRFFILTANPEHYQNWLDSYDSTQVVDTKLIGQKVLPDGSESQDILFLRPLKDIQRSLEEASLSIVATKTIRTWLIIEGVKV